MAAPEEEDAGADDVADEELAGRLEVADDELLETEDDEPPGGILDTADDALPPPGLATEMEMPTGSLATPETL